MSKPPSTSKATFKQYRLGRLQFAPRYLISIALLMGGGWVMARPVLAASATPGIIQNQATGSFVDTSDGSTKAIESNIVQVTVAEVAGITVTATGTSGSFNPGQKVYFTYTITNVGNDPTQFFIPSAANLTGNATQSSNIEITGYSIDGNALTTLSTPVVIPNGGGQTGRNASSTPGLLKSPNPNGEFQSNGYITVRVPVLINPNANAGNIVTVQLGDTPVDPASGSTPQVRLENQPYIAGTNDLYTVDDPDSLGVTNEAVGSPINGDTTYHRQEASAVSSITVVVSNLTVSGLVFSDADADVTINGSDAGTSAGSGTLTIYAINTAGNVVDKATVGTDGTYSLANIPVNSSVTLRLSNDSSKAIGSTAPTVSSIPSGWYFTGENKNGTVDGTIATLGKIALTTATSNITNQNFGIRQSYVLTAAPVPATCSANFTTTLNTGVSASGAQLTVGSNDLNWTTEWIAGPTSGAYTPYATPRPVGALPAVVVGNLAPGAWVNSPSSVQWISYPFRLSSNSNGNSQDANLNGTPNEQNDTVRVKFTAKVTLPSNASNISVSLPVGVSADNQFVSLKVNGVENLLPSPTQNAYAYDYRTIQTVNIQNGWQPGVNTIEIIVDSGPPLTGFFLGVQATSTQVCSNPNVLLVKRITSVNGSTSSTQGDDLAVYQDDPSTTNDNNSSTVHWPDLKSDGTPDAYLLGGINGGLVQPNDLVEYTIYFLSTGSSSAKNVALCDRIPNNQTFVPNGYNALPDAPNSDPTSDRGIAVSYSGNLFSYTNNDDGDTAKFYPAGSTLPAVCGTGINTSGAILVNLGAGATGTNTTSQGGTGGTIPNATAPGTPATSYGFVRFKAKVN